MAAEAATQASIKYVLPADTYSIETAHLPATFAPKLDCLGGRRHAPRAPHDAAMTNERLERTDDCNGNRCRSTERSDHPALRAYYARLTVRAAYREHVMVSYDALRVT
jgi:hypothetical protein